MCADSVLAAVKLLQNTLKLLSLELFYCSWEYQELRELIIRDNKNNAFFSR